MQSNAAVIRSNGGKLAACCGLVSYQCGVIWWGFYVFVVKYIIRPWPSCLWNPPLLDLLRALFEISSGASERQMQTHVQLHSDKCVRGFQWTVWPQVMSVFSMCFGSLWVWGGWHWFLTFAPPQHFWYSRGQGETEHKHKLNFPRKEKPPYQPHSV